jgi:chromosomal replication initiation ATPase DnaA
MTVHVPTLTKTEAKAAERRRAFHRSIEEKAAALKIAKPAIRTAEPSAPIQTDGYRVWFHVLPDDDAPRHPKIAEIQNAVAKYFLLTQADLCSQRLDQAVVRPRQIAAYLCKELTLQPLTEIGRRFGGRDHSTILYAVRKIERLMRTDAAVALDVATLTERIAGAAQ